MTKDDIVSALKSIRGAEVAPSPDNAQNTVLRLGGRDIALVDGDKVDLHLSRARLIAAGVGLSALADCRKDWTLIDPIPITAGQLETIVAILASGQSHPPAGKRFRR